MTSRFFFLTEYTANEIDSTHKDQLVYFATK